MEWNGMEWNGIGYHIKFQIIVSDKSLVTAMKIKVIHVYSFESYEMGCWKKWRRLVKKMKYYVKSRRQESSYIQ
jgi:IS1 family transposase